MVDRHVICIEAVSISAVHSGNLLILLSELSVGRSLLTNVQHVSNLHSNT